MAAAFFNQLADHTKAEAVSAGTEPDLSVHPEVVTVMQEVGLDLTQAKPKKLTLELTGGASLLITMGCGDKCPYVPVCAGTIDLSRSKGLPLQEVRFIRDEVRLRVSNLIKSEGLQSWALVAEVGGTTPNVTNRTLRICRANLSPTEQQSQ